MYRDELLAEVDKRTQLAYSNEMEMLTFFLTDGQLYGLNVFKIIEILECPKTVTKMPNAKDSIKGAIDFRGHAISLIDLAEAMGMEPVDRDNVVSYVLVCEYSTTTQGFLISQPNMLLHKSWDDIISPEGGVYDTSYLTAITYHEGETIQILDVEKILGEIIGIDDQVSDELVEQASDVGAHKLQILVADDSKAARMLLESALSQMGAHFTLCESATKAWEVLQASADAETGQSSYNLIISDIEMPGMDGFEASEAIRARHVDTRIIMVTAYGREEAAQAAEGAGITGFLTKPVSPSTLLDAVMTALGREAVSSRRADQRLDEEHDAVAQLKGAKVLLVEDNEINQELALELLANGGIVADVANNGQEALDKLKQHHYDAVLMDVQMPVMDGFSATRAIREWERALQRPPMPIVALTANAMKEDVEEAHQAGCDLHLTKPVKKQTLLQTLASVSLGSTMDEN